MLASRLPEPKPNEIGALATVDDFLGYLYEWPLAAWLTIGRELSASGSLHSRRLAWMDVEVAITDHRLEIAAWRVRDAIETAVCLASRKSSRWSREERCVFAAAHAAAEGAALALLVQRYIPAESLGALCAPLAKPRENQQRS
ncbi:MAG TPA: hypothetical protein VFR41_15610 [Acidimicrobiia bacterium]|nr:hypothetical protein [Acidimicrobiia bacterium]